MNVQNMFISTGLGVDNVISMDVVLSNGTTARLSKCTHSDLWWAFRGGGGGTFGVLVSATHIVHDNPGFVSLSASYPIRMFAPCEK